MCARVAHHRPVAKAQRADHAGRKGYVSKRGGLEREDQPTEEIGEEEDTERHSMMKLSFTEVAGLCSPAKDPGVLTRRPRVDALAPRGVRIFAFPLEVQVLCETRAKRARASGRRR